MRLIIRPTFADASYSIWIIRDDGRETQVAKPFQLQFEKLVEGQLLPEPSMIVRSHEFEQIFNSLDKELILNGIKREAVNLEGVLEAQKKHLEDMRTLVFTGKSL